MAGTDHVSQEELAGRLAAAAEIVEVGARYVHYKHPDKEYILKALVIIEATEEVGVVYEAQYDERISFLRPLSSFTEEVPWECTNAKRFRKVPGTP